MLRSPAALPTTLSAADAAVRQALLTGTRDAAVLADAFYTAAAWRQLLRDEAAAGNLLVGPSLVEGC